MTGPTLSGERGTRRPCWKTAYRRKAAPQRVAKRRRGDEGIELHAYLCERCGAYHLTSKAPGDFRAQVQS